MSVADNAAAWMVNIANDNSHGYDQGNRWGPNYDCSSLVISAYKAAGVPLQSTYTGNMKGDFLSHGFSDVTNSVNRANGAGMQRGDVLLNIVHHTAMYIGNGQICEAGGNEFGGVTGGKSGDQTGNEIRCRAYYNFPWDCVLRYTASGGSVPSPVPTPSGSGTSVENASGGSVDSNGVYTVKSGDSLWAIAERLLGNGSRYTEIMTLNNLRTPNILVGQKLKIPVSGNSGSQPVPSGNTQMAQASMPVLRYGSVGVGVRVLQAALNARGASPQLDVDGDFGTETKTALMTFNASAGVSPTDTASAKTWEALVK